MDNSQKVPNLISQDNKVDIPAEVTPSPSDVGSKNSNRKNRAKPDMKKRNTIIIASAVALIVLGVGGHFGWQYLNREEISEYNQLVSDAEEQYIQRNYADALNYLNQAVELRPNESAAYEWTVLLLIDKYQLTDASTVLTEAGNVIPNNTEAQLWGEIGNTYYMMGDYENAATALTNSLKADSQDKYELLYAKNQLALGSTEDVAKYVKDSGDILEDLYTDYTNKVSDQELSLFDSTKAARNYINAGYPYLAIEMLKGRTADMEEYWEGLFFLGTAYYEFGDPAKALEHLEPALTLGVDDSQLYLETARAMYEQSDVDTAIKMYARAIAYADKDDKFGILEEYVMMLNAEELYSQAVAALVSNGSSSDVDVVYLYLYTYNQAGENDNVGEYLDALAEATLPNEWEYLRDYRVIAAQYYLSEEMYDEFNTIITALEEADAYEPYVPYYQAKLAEATGEDGALELLYTAIDYDLKGELTGQAEKLIATIESRD